MKKFFKLLSAKAKYAYACMMLAFAAVPMALAQTDDSVSQAILNGTEQGLQGIVPGIIRVLKIIVIIGGAISLLLVVFNIIQGERDAAKKAGWWLVGLVLGFIVLTLLGNVSGNIQ